MLGQLGAGAQNAIRTDGIAKRLAHDIPRERQLSVRRRIRRQPRHTQQRPDADPAGNEQPCQPAKRCGRRARACGIDRVGDEAPGDEGAERNANAPGSDARKSLSVPQHIGARRRYRHPVVSCDSTSAPTATKAAR